MITKLLISLLTIGLFFIACEKKEQQDTKVDAPIVKDETIQKIDKVKEVSEKTEKNVLILKDTNGDTYRLKATENGINFDGLEDKIVILDFFATWCPPCRAEMPHLVNLQKKYEGKIQILSVLMEEDKDNQDLHSFAKEYNLNFPILNSNENFLLSEALGGIKSLPTLVMYDKKGNYFTHYVGAAPEEMIEADINKALAK